MDITVQELSNVDREITVKAGTKQLGPRFDKALKDIRKKATLPGFRPGQAPMGLIKKRFGKDVELDEINRFIQEVYKDEVVPKFKPIGEPQITNMKWEEGILEVVFKIGARPDFELVDLSKITVDKMVHDVMDDEIDKEIEHTLRRKGAWNDSDEVITADSKIVVDAAALDDHGHQHSSDVDLDKELDLASPENDEIRDQLVGKKTGDVVEVTFAHGDHSHKYNLTIKKNLVISKPELTPEFIKEVTNNEADNVENYRSILKSRVQDYYDRASEDVFREKIADSLVEAHTFDIPETVIDAVISSFIEELKQKNKGDLPAGFEREQYRERVYQRAVNESKWMFIQDKIADKFPNIEIQKEDVDTYLTEEAARYGLPVDMIKQYYASSSEQMEQLRFTLRSKKLFATLAGEVNANEISKDEYQKNNA